MQASLYCGDALAVLRTLPDGAARCCVTSPPYFGLRDYGVEGQMGLEATPDAYVARMVELFREVRRVLADDGTLWLNLGDSYARAAEKGGSGPNGKNVAAYGESYGVAQSAKAGSSDGAVGRADRPGSRSIGDGLKPKDLIGIPWRVAFALQADGWYLRSDIIWHKPNPMPESVRDRPTKAHEYLFLLSKAERYFYDAAAIVEDATVGSTRNARTVWTIATKPYKGAHFATFPFALAEKCVLAGSAPGDTVLDPFGGSGTVGSVAVSHLRNALHIDLNEEYIGLAEARIGAGLCRRATP